MFAARARAGPASLSVSPPRAQWHPFTISSARGDLDREDIVTVHIRVIPVRRRRRSSSSSLGMLKRRARRAGGPTA